MRKLRNPFTGKTYEVPEVTEKDIEKVEELEKFLNSGKWDPKSGEIRYG